MLPRPVAAEREATIDLIRLRIFRNETVIIGGFLLLLVLLVTHAAFGVLSGMFERLAAALP